MFKSLLASLILNAALISVLLVKCLQNPAVIHESDELAKERIRVLDSSFTALKSTTDSLLALPAKRDTIREKIYIKLKADEKFIEAATDRQSDSIFRAFISAGHR